MGDPFILRGSSKGKEEKGQQLERRIGMASSDLSNSHHPPSEHILHSGSPKGASDDGMPPLVQEKHLAAVEVLKCCQGKFLPDFW